MFFKIWLLAASLGLQAQSGAGPIWRRAVSAGVEVHTDAGPGMAARVLAETLSFYAACARARGLQESPPALKVVHFAREADFKRIRAEGGSKAFFQRSGDANWVVVHGGPDAVRRLRHELVHVMNDRAGWSFVPVWLNEGLAEYYSALDVSAASQGRVRVASIELLARQVTVESGSFGESDLASRRVAAGPGLFYARAWALVRQLAAEGGESSLNRLAGLLRDGTPAGQAFTAVYGASMDEMIARARRSAGRMAFAGMWLGRDWPPALAVSESAVSGFDADLMLGELARSGGLQTEAERRHEEALKRAGLGPDSHSRLAMVELRRGNLDAALAQMERAAGQGSRDALMWFEYAMLMRETGVARVKWVSALRRAVELDPQRGEAWFVLGVSAEGEESITALERAVQANPAKPWLWETYGRALLKAGRRDNARAAAQEALRRAVSLGDRSMAEALLAEVDAPDSTPGPAPPAVVTPGSWTISPAPVQVEGWLVEADCSAESPVLIVESEAGGRTRASVKRPGSVSVKGGGQFSCGSQRTKRRVVLGHDGKPDAALATVGDLLSIHYK